MQAVFDINTLSVKPALGRALPRPNRPRRSRRRTGVRLRRGDGWRLALASAGLAGLLLLIFFTAGRMNMFVADGKPGPTAAQLQAEALAEAAAEAYSHRVGSIVFASHERFCEERLFDNATGRLSVERQVDCETRLLQTNSSEATKAKTARMRGVLASFRR